jgi:hypothetical protein
MKYFIDTEFIEGKQRLRKTWLEALTATKKLTEPTIDLISIGIVAEDGREYYAISKDFNLSEAWFRYDIKTMTNLPGDSDTNKMKVYWLRDNVLKPIWEDIWREYVHYGLNEFYNSDFTLSNFKKIIKAFGKSNKEIAQGVKEFCSPKVGYGRTIGSREPNLGLPSVQSEYGSKIKNERGNPEFYGYYADYDWVVFCWLFGNMMDLPSGFPMYCKDLKQMLDSAINNTPKYGNYTFEESTKIIKNYSNYPKQTNEHNALADARWNFELYKFLKQL